MKFGWKPELSDHRDIIFSYKGDAGYPLKPAPIQDQGDTSACVAFATCAAWRMLNPKKSSRSEMYLYWYARYLEDTASGSDLFTLNDTGSYIRNAVKVGTKTGLASSKMWPFNPLHLQVTPPPPVDSNALKYRFSGYARCTKVDHILDSIMSGRPVVGGFTVFDNIGQYDGTPQAGYIPLPKNDSKPLGGHAVCIFDVDVKQNCFIFQNSWGVKWGQKGIGKLPFGYMTKKLLDDCWSLS